MSCKQQPQQSWSGCADIKQNKLENKKKFSQLTIDKEGHSIMIKGSVQQENMTVINMCLIMEYQNT